MIFVHPEDYERLDRDRDDVLEVRNLRRTLESGGDVVLECDGRIVAKHISHKKQVDVILAAA